VADVRLFQGEASPGDIILRALDEPPKVQPQTDIFLLSGATNPSDVVLRGPFTPSEPVVVPVVISGSPIPIYKKGERVHRRGSVWLRRFTNPDSKP